MQCVPPEIFFHIARFCTLETVKTLRLANKNSRDNISHLRIVRACLLPHVLKFFEGFTIDPSWISDIANLPSGLLMVVDFSGHTVYTTDKSGKIVDMIGCGDSGSTSKYKDGSFKDARFYYPRSLIVDSNGDLYLTDCDNHYLRHIDMTTALVSTIEYVKFDKSPHDICYDLNGDLLIAVEYGSKICRCNLKKETQIEYKLIPGKSIPKFRPHGLAVHPKTGILYVLRLDMDSWPSNYKHLTISRVIDGKVEDVYTHATGIHPIKFDSIGNLYFGAEDGFFQMIIEEDTHRVFKIQTKPSITNITAFCINSQDNKIIGVFKEKGTTKDQDKPYVMFSMNC